MAQVGQMVRYARIGGLVQVPGALSPGGESLQEEKIQLHSRGERGNGCHGAHYVSRGFSITIQFRRYVAI